MLWVDLGRSPLHCEPFGGVAPAIFTNPPLFHIVEAIFSSLQLVNPMMITPWPLVYTDGSRKIGILLTLACLKLGLKKGYKLVNKNILQIF